MKKTEQPHSQIFFSTEQKAMLLYNKGVSSFFVYRMWCAEWLKTVAQYMGACRFRGTVTITRLVVVAILKCSFWMFLSVIVQWSVTHKNTIAWQLHGQGCPVNLELQCQLHADVSENTHCITLLIFLSCILFHSNSFKCCLQNTDTSKCWWFYRNRSKHLRVKCEWTVQ